MLDGPAVANALVECGVTHAVWVPDTEIGRWEQALSSQPALQLIRVCREGEAFAVAGGLLLGGQKPIILIQCTGLFEAGDSLRNFVHDLGLPLFMVVGLRSYHAHRQGRSADTCPLFAEPILAAWKVPCVLLDESATGEDLRSAYLQAKREHRAGAALLAE